MRRLKSDLVITLFYLHCFWMGIGRVQSRPASIPRQQYTNNQVEKFYHNTFNPVDLSAEKSQQARPQVLYQAETANDGDGFQRRLRSSDNRNIGVSPPDIPEGLEAQSSLPCAVLNDLIVNCSGRNLYSIPTTAFPTRVESFDLSHNHIQSLPSHAFSRYTMLKELNLEQNKISKIDPLAFESLSQLTFLNLCKNKLVMNKTTLQNAFSEMVFVPLKNLRKLRLEGNNPQPNSEALMYPSRALSHLSNLQELYLDGLKNAVFGSGFGNLTLLSNLTLEGYRFGNCDLTGLTNETFRYLTPVKMLRINNCNLQGHLIEAGTFLPLKQLETLHIDHNPDINVQFFDRIFFGLQNTTTLKELYMQYVVSPYTLGVCLSSRYIKYFPQSVEYLDIKQNRLECIDRDVIDKIKRLITIDIGKNSFVFGTYFMDLHKFERLETLYADDMILKANKLPVNYPYNPHVPPLETDNCSLYERRDQDNENGKLVLHLPPTLHHVKIRYSNIVYIFSRLNIGENNSLEYLQIEGNYIPQLIGPVIGMNTLQNLHFSLNYVNEISDTFFHPLSSLTTLNLSRNYLGDFFQVNQKTNVFHPLVNLQILDLSVNAIRVLGQSIFDGMTELTYLKISHNPIFRFDPNLSGMNRLQHFIAVDTDLSNLPKEARNAISRRAEMGHFQAELAESPILCDCQNLPFLEWMMSSKAFNLTSNGYRCHYPDTSSMEIQDGYANARYELSRECTSHQSLFLALGAGTIGLIIFLICSVAYRYRWKFRYMYHAAYIYLTSSKETRSANTFDYDVFLCYAEEDRHFVMDMLCPALEARGLSVFLHHRHFTAGELIGSNIVRAVNTCRRTVVVLTRTLAESSWCNYEIQMANMETAQRGKPVLIFLLMDGIRWSEMKNELLYNIQNNTYIPFPPQSFRNGEALNALYNRLARDIRD